MRRGSYAGSAEGTGGLRELIVGLRRLLRPPPLLILLRHCLLDTFEQLLR